MRKLVIAALLFAEVAGAAPAFVGTPSTPAVANNTNATAALGGTTISGDLAVAWYGCNAASSCAVTAPISGYTAGDSRVAGAQKIYVDWKAAGAGESDPTATRTGGSAGDSIFGAGMILRGANTTTPVAHSTNAAGSTTSTTVPAPALTIITNNTKVCLYITIGGVSLTSWGTYNPNGTGAWTLVAHKEDATITNNSSMALYCTDQTTAANITAANVAVTGAGTHTYRSVMIAWTSVIAPTFTSVPVIGTRTTSGIPFNLTSDTTGTVYAARFTDGTSLGSVTCDQLEAQTASGAVQYANEAVVATVADTLTFGSITNGTITDGAFCIEDALGNDSAVYIAGDAVDMYKLPAWTTPPTVTARAFNTHTVSFQLDGPGTIYGVGCAKGKTAATYSNTLAGQCGDSVAANAANNKSVTTSADTLVLTYASPQLVYDIYVAATYGAQPSSVTTLATEVAGAASGYTAPYALTSICTSAACPVKVYNDSVATDIVTGDYCSYSTVTDPDSFTVTGELDGNITLSCTPSNCPATPQHLQVKCQDLSAFAMFSGFNPGDIYPNWLSPSCGVCSLSLEGLNVGDAITATDISALFTDPQSSAQTFARTAGTFTTNLVINGAGVVSGIPDTEVESGNTVTITDTNLAGLTADLSLTTYTFTTATMPNCVGQTSSSCEGLLLATHAGLSLNSATYQCSGLTSGVVISQSPTAGTEVEPSTTLDLIVAKQCINASKIGITLRIGL